jgi:Fusaric acid resistance protein-like
MDSEAFSLQRVKLRAFDLSDRTIRRGEASAVRRIERWRQRAFVIIQCAVTAGLAWLIASMLLGHEVPYFAAAAAILVLGVAYGQRLRRGVDVAIGVTLGVALGDLWLVLFGAGVWQVVLVCAIAMSLATLIGAGPLITTQAGAQSIAVLVMAPSPMDLNAGSMQQSAPRSPCLWRPWHQVVRSASQVKSRPKLWLGWPRRSRQLPMRSQRRRARC